MATIEAATDETDNVNASYRDAEGRESFSVFTPAGRYWFHNQDSQFDLVELVPDVPILWAHDPAAPQVELARDALHPDYVTLKAAKA